MREQVAEYIIPVLKDGEDFMFDFVKGTRLTRCKDCIFFEYNHFERVNGVPVIVAHEICTALSGGSKTSENGWCFMAEMKEANK